LADHVWRATGLEVLEVEKYQYNYYVTVGRNGKPLQELLVFPNGAIQPEPQSMMWLGQPMYIDNATALAIAKKWLDTYFPGTEAKEVYTFPGYYTVHFTTSDGDMQMNSISGYNGAVIFHKWHGKHIQQPDLFIINTLKKLIETLLLLFLLLFLLLYLFRRRTHGTPIDMCI